MESNGEYWGNDLWRHWCHFPCKLINRKYIFLCIFDTRCQKEKSFIVLQKSKSLENQPEKIFNILSSRFFVNNFLYHFYHNVKQKTKIPLRKPRYNKQKTKKWTVNVLNPNKQQNIHQFQGEYRISGALNVLLPELHLSFTWTKNKEQQGRFGLSQLLLGCMHSAINT